MSEIITIPKQAPGVPEAGDEPPGVDITAVTKLKHADLWAAAKKLGGQSALARHLGIQPTEVGQWINLKRCPPAEPVGMRWTEDYITEMEAKLLVLTGKDWDELFPQALRDNAEFLYCDKTLEKTAYLRAGALQRHARLTRERLERFSSSTEAERQYEAQECSAAIGKVLKTLSYREREIIKLRFGLGDGYNYTTDEIAHIFKVTRERIRQIEDKAMRKLQQPSRSNELLEYVKTPDEE